MAPRAGAGRGGEGRGERTREAEEVQDVDRYRA